MYQVDVIVPVYNVETYLNECIDSILLQSYPNIHIILVDDGATDGSGKICDTYAEKNDNIKVIHKENGGLVSAWRMGLLASDADWVVFVDGDDWIEKRHIEGLVKEQVKNDADVVVMRMKQIESSGSQYIDLVAEYGCYKKEKLYTQLYPIMINAGKFEKRGVPFSRCSKLIKKNLIVKNLKYSFEKGTFEEDLNIIVPVLMDADVICLVEIEEAAYCYRRLETSMLHGYDANMRTSVDHIYPALRLACKEKGKELFLPQIEFEYISALIRCVTNELQNPGGLKETKKNIQSLSRQLELRAALGRVDYRAFPFQILLVYKMLKNYNWFQKNIITVVLWIAKRTRH